MGVLLLTKVESNSVMSFLALILESASVISENSIAISDAISLSKIFTHKKITTKPKRFHAELCA